MAFKEDGSNDFCLETLFLICRTRTEVQPQPNECYGWSWSNHHHSVGVSLVGGENSIQRRWDFMISRF